MAGSRRVFTLLIRQEGDRHMQSKHFIDLFNIVKDYRFFIQMIKDKRYTIPFARKLVYILLVVYIIIPFDFIPGIFPLVGMVDDLGAFAAIIGVLLYEITVYRDFLDGIRGRAGSRETSGEKRIDDRIVSDDKTKK
jgi:uncharacterized membrane protein YkvA (DUF1232 family)